MFSYEMKKIWKSVLRTMKNRNYQQKAIKYAEDMEKTEVYFHHLIMFLNCLNKCL
ncbi:unnamed protein product [Brugia timori]|uniref:Uncharacterized protein n=1 Tax=Brugia timori TaxID=42155 RepID=A0A3P7ZRE0_9BILA|nr:unnamed protein product [Brugia timori]